uniref:RNB domain-containing protein n=1 Tax=viral metagenome TaxID=1070528 RepID=A0A6C0B3D3_9ZZZZ
MKEIKILISDNKYTSWDFHCHETNAVLSVDEFPELGAINPIADKLFSRDVLVLENGSFKVIKSYVKSASRMAGVLMLENNKTFGRTANKKRLLYKCIPDDKHVPPFLVPYDVKVGFSKVQKNKYVVFCFNSWTEKHPHGLLIETLGDVDNLEVFYEYQLYCKSLHVSLTDFTNKTRQELNKKTTDEYVDQILKNPAFKIEDRRDRYIFTIDPKTSTDYDDGYAIEKLENGEYKISIYIANVYLWLETLGLWDSFSKRVATIYLPDRRRPMLPTILSDTLCSLQQKQPRFAFTMEFIMGTDGPRDIQYKNVLIQVGRNYYYEEPELHDDSSYQQLLEISKRMNTNVVDSHDVIAHWMVFMNMHSAELLHNNNMGVFRSVTYVNPVVNTIAGIDEDTVRVIQSWNNTIGQYVAFNGQSTMKHDFMKATSYVHITSPIRRLVDLLNQIILFGGINLVAEVSTNAKRFLDTWLGELDYLNTSMRSIRKVQTDCALLDRCFQDPEIMEKEYTGIVFDKMLRDNFILSYMVYLKELKMLSRINIIVDVDNFSSHKFKLFLFQNEEKTKKKIRLQIIDK